VGLIADLLTTQEISEWHKKEMFSILNDYFDNVTYADFRRDLQDKDWVILLKEAGSEKVRGFSTQKLIRVKVNNIPVKALFSGDTIISKEYWGGFELVKKWFDLVFSIMEDGERAKLYWFLISMGYRTYRYLPVYFKEYYPRFDRMTPSFEKSVINALGSLKFPNEYDSQKGVIHFDQKAAHLKNGFSEIPENKLKDPNVSFFLKKNAKYIEGDELVCIAELSFNNFKPVVCRITGREIKTGVN